MSSKTLLSKIIKTKSYENIKQLISKIVDIFRPPIAVISHIKTGIIKVVKELLLEIKHKFCHPHFLNSVEKGILKVSYKALKEKIEKKNKSQLRKVKKVY